jgi:O-antigen/teichoic acid export membrane protein
VKSAWGRMGATGRASAVFTAAVVGGNLAQVAWLIGGARALPGGHFGTVLAAQALYAVLQMIADNGTSFLGARWSARGPLDSSQRLEIVRARFVLAAGCAVAGMIVALAGGMDMLEAFAPFAAALVLFSILNVWERYGAGNLVPFANYLLLRSLLIGALAGAVAITGGHLPLVAAGCCELAAILIVGLVWSAWSLPRGGLRVSATTWRSARDIGLPAVLTQYNLAVGTVALGVAGQTSAAALSGVAFRLLTGLQGLNGAIGSAVFPMLARSPEPGPRQAQASRLAAASGVVVAAIALGVVAVAAGPIVHLLLDGEGAIEESALILAVATAGATGLVMHRSFALVAGQEERLLRSASTFGAIVVSIGTVSALFVSGLSSALVVLAAFSIGQVLTLLIVGSAGTGADRRLTLAAILFMPAFGIVMALFDDARVPLTVAGLAIGTVLVGGWHRRLRADRHATTVGGPDD